MRRAGAHPPGDVTAPESAASGERAARSWPGEIRPARAADAGEIAALLGELGYPATREEVARRLAALAGPDDDDAVQVAAGADGAVVGVIGLHRLRTLHAPSPPCYITALVVAASARGRGVGRRLLEAAESWARERGCGRMVVTSAEHRADAHAFYERSGYERTGRRFGRALP